MLFYNRIGQQFIGCVQALAKVHFIIQLVQSTVTLPANGNGILQLYFAKPFFKMRAAMELSRNKVVSGQLRCPLTQITLPYSALCQIFLSFCQIAPGCDWF